MCLFCCADRFVACCRPHGQCIAAAFRKCSVGFRQLQRSGPCLLSVSLSVICTSDGFASSRFGCNCSKQFEQGSAGEHFLGCFGTLICCYGLQLSDGCRRAECMAFVYVCSRDMCSVVACVHKHPDSVAVLST